mmetsp:Transcript_40919/g.115864  ORF Transcript_40919/g.115864 Transcript_40919/m.115864 type:complete len:373 (+) Transcript_40919:938-2056(+)
MEGRQLMLRLHRARIQPHHVFGLLLERSGRLLELLPDGQQLRLVLIPQVFDLRLQAARLLQELRGIVLALDGFLPRGQRVGLEGRVLELQAPNAVLQVLEPLPPEVLGRVVTVPCDGRPLRHLELLLQLLEDLALADEGVPGALLREARRQRRAARRQRRAGGVADEGVVEVIARGPQAGGQRRRGRLQRRAQCVPSPVGRRRRHTGGLADPRQDLRPQRGQRGVAVRGHAGLQVLLLEDRLPEVLMEAAALVPQVHVLLLQLVVLRAGRPKILRELLVPGVGRLELPCELLAPGLSRPEVLQEPAVLFLQVLDKRRQRRLGVVRALDDRLRPLGLESLLAGLGLLPLHLLQPLLHLRQGAVLLVCLVARIL